jgi:uncharacterized protein YcfL
MQKVGIVLACCVVVGFLLLSGCSSQSGVVSKDLSSKVVLDAHGLVKFVNSSMSSLTNKSGGVTSVCVSWMFESIVDRTINISINVQFYDAANRLLYNQSKQLENMPAGYKEQSFGPANWVMYSGLDAARVDHVIISTTEFQVIS